MTTIEQEEKRKPTTEDKAMIILGNIFCYTFVFLTYGSFLSSWFVLMYHMLMPENNWFMSEHQIAGGILMVMFSGLGMIAFSSFNTYVKAKLNGKVE